MKVSYELEQGYIDIWNEESEEWDRYIKVNKKSVVEEEKKIPEKLDLILNEHFTNDELQAYIYETQEKVNEIIDYLESKGE